MKKQHSRDFNELDAQVRDMLDSLEHSSQRMCDNERQLVDTLNNEISKMDHRCLDRVLVWLIIA